jgi:uncharacterized protein YmfQ (DUF2313 family)
MAEIEQEFDRHIRRTGDDYAQALADLLPTGPAWPREDSSTLMRLVNGLAHIFGYVDARAADFLERESDPRKTLEMLDTWEFNWGLPDPCYRQAQTIDQRHQLLLFKMTLLGAQDRQFFIDMAAWLGYEITITEYAPFMAGVSQAGDTRGMINWNDTPGQHPEVIDYRWQIMAPEGRFYWTVHIINAPLTWFRSAAGQAGVDPHLRIGYARDLECLLNRWKPAHTLIVYDYSNLKTGDPMAGTP